MTGSDLSPLGFLNATVHVTPSRTVSGELWTTDRRIRYAGTPAEAPHPPGATVTDASGASIVPLLVESAVNARPKAERDGYDLRPGNPATFAVIRGQVSEARIRQMLVVAPRDLIAVVVSGHPEVWYGEPTRSHWLQVTGTAHTTQALAWLGAWADPSRGMTQYLLPDGRYTETRGGRVNAYTGRFWVRERRITYLDDSGFWAFGELRDGVLHHAGFVLRQRSPTRPGSRPEGALGPQP